MISLSVAVMAHPKRTLQACGLARQLDAEIVWDERNDEWDTGARALAAFASWATHHLVIQDDALPVDGFRAHAFDAIERRPAGPVSFYLGRSRPTRWQNRFRAATEAADAAGHSWLDAQKMHHGVAFALPTAHIPALLAEMADSLLPFDQRISAWYETQGMPVMHTWPSLVEHADDGSLVEHGYTEELIEPRVAWRVGVPASWDTPATMIERDSDDHGL